MNETGGSAVALLAIALFIAIQLPFTIENIVKLQLDLNFTGKFDICH